MKRDCGLVIDSSRAGAKDAVANRRRNRFRGSAPFKERHRQYPDQRTGRRAALRLAALIDGMAIPAGEMDKDKTVKLVVAIAL
ncbi:MAG: hypothetical protein OXN89_11205 [Bryobacterales bacterium]|nr:hypothetical protein [Bryobacterales bacterium]